MISSSIFFATIIWIFSLVFLRLILKYKLFKSYSEKELLLKKIRTERLVFPSWYRFFYHCLGIFLPLSLTIFLFFLFWLSSYDLQKLLNLTRGPGLFFGINHIGYLIIYLLYGFAMSLFVSKLVFMLFPMFDKYQSAYLAANFATGSTTKEKNKKKRFLSFVHNFDINKNAVLQWRHLFLFTYWILTISGPFLILLLDNYVLVKNTSVVVNPLFSVFEREYNFSSISKVIISKSLSRKYRSTDSVSVVPGFVIIFNDGKSFNIWENLGVGSPPKDSLIQAATILHKNSVRFEIKDLTQNQGKYTNEEIKVLSEDGALVDDIVKLVRESD